MDDETNTAEKIRSLGHDTASVKLRAAQGELEEWVHAYLACEGWANPGLSDGLKKQKRWWNGPLQVDPEVLRRVVGPESHMEYRRDAKEWSKDLRELAGSLGDPLSIPPLIAEYHEGVPDLRLADGNTRYGAMNLLGWAKCWVIIWYNSEEDRRRHGDELGIESRQDR